MGIHEGLRTRAAKLSAAAQSLKRQSGVRDIPFSLAYLTDAARGPDPALVARALPEGAAIILRDYAHPRRAALAKQLKSVCSVRGIFLVVGEDERLAREINADGVHLPSRCLGKKPLSYPVLSASCHNLEELALAHRARAKAGFLSPVFATGSHPGASPLGPETFRDIANAAPIPVLALGGADETNAHLLAAKNVAGLGAIGAFSARSAVDR